MASSSDFESASRGKQGVSPSSWSAVPEAIPRVDLRSRGPLPELPDPRELPLPFIAAAGDSRNDPVHADPPGNAHAGEMFWLRGDVLMCACPDCAAPMTVRLWLMVADCWRCEASIELTEEQEREARRILQQRTVPGDLATDATLPISPTTAGEQAVRAALGHASGWRHHGVAT